MSLTLKIVKNICAKQQYCDKCPLLINTCSLVAEPEDWNIELIEKQYDNFIKQKLDDNDIEFTC